MKKFFILLVNIFLFLGILVCTDYYKAKEAYSAYYQNIKHNSTSQKENPAKVNFYYTLNIFSFDKKFSYMKRHMKEMHRITGNFFNNKSPIIVFGCSFARGSIKENFEYQLSKKTNRKIYNFAFSGLGIANMYRQLKRNDFSDILEKNENPEYAIYIFITDHIYRLYTDKYGSKERIYIKDDIQTENIKTHIFRQLCRLYIGRNLINKYIYRNYLISEYNDKNFDLLSQYFRKSKEKLSQKYPNIKFVILKYPTAGIGYPAHNELYDSERWNELSQDGFIVIDLKKYVNVDLTSEKYIFSDYHPNKEAWDVITDKLANDINNGEI